MSYPTAYPTIVQCRTCVLFAYPTAYSVVLVGPTFWKVRQKYAVRKKKIVQVGPTFVVLAYFVVLVGPTPQKKCRTTIFCLTFSKSRAYFLYFFQDKVLDFGKIKTYLKPQGLHMIISLQLLFKFSIAHSKNYTKNAKNINIWENHNKSK